MENKKKNKQTREAVLDAARQLLAAPDFLYRVGNAIGSLGVVGEKRNRLVVFLAGITKELPEPVSLMVKGPSSGGKSNLIRHVLRVFPRDSIVERTSLSGKAPAYSEVPLANKILFLQEYRGGKDAQLLLRLLQTEGKIAHEATAIAGKRAGTRVVEKHATCAVMTTTTEDQIFEDDCTRFLATYVDQSPEQTLAIAKSRIQTDSQRLSPRLRVWQHAVGLITTGEGDFQKPPQWLEFVAENLPLDQVRVRRDWGRFLALCQAVALCRRGVGTEPTDITFADYVVAFKVFEPALAATVRAMHPREAELLSAIDELSGKARKGVAPRAIAQHLNWKPPLVYQYLRVAAEHEKIEYEPGTRERNQKLVLPTDAGRIGFLPPPITVLRNRTDLPRIIKFLDPFTGKSMLARA